MYIKICGITRLEDAQAAVAAGASALGFVFWPKSPRYIEPVRAKEIVATLPPSVKSVGVFVDQPIEKVNRIADEVDLRSVQLHGDETDEYIAQMTREVIKAIAVGREHVPALSKWPKNVMILLDVHDPVRKGGTGHVIDWVVAHDISQTRPIILAGGLTPENVADAIKRVRPYGIDVSSGVETEPGIKDHGRIKALFEAVYGSHYATRS